MLRELAVNTRVIYYLMALLAISAGYRHTAGLRDRRAGKSSESADIESDAEGGREYVQEYTPTDKTRKSKIRTCMYGA